MPDFSHRLFHCEADLEHDLIVMNSAILDVAAGLHDLKPAEIPQALASPCDGTLDCVLDALLG
jgi:hypothetical protein